MKEIIGYVLSFIFVIFMTLGLFGAFDKDKDNPFINKKQSGGGMVDATQITAERWGLIRIVILQSTNETD